MSANLGLPQIAANQDQKEATSNDADAQLDEAMTSLLPIDFTAGDVTLALSDFQSNMAFIGQNNSTGSEHFNLPVCQRAVFLITNTGTGALNIVLGTTTLTLAVGHVGAFMQDGTANGLTKWFDGAYSGSVPTPHT